jgi:hypothetical protein
VKRTLHEASVWLVPLLLPAALACSSTGVGNPVTGTLSLAIVSDDEDGPAAEPAPAVLNDAAASALAPDGSAPVEPLPRGSLQRAVLVLGSVRWLPCDASAEVVTQSGPFMVDLIAGETRPALPELRVPEGGLCGFDAPLAPGRSAELLGRSLLFSGVRMDGVRFVLFANMRATLRVRPASGEVWGDAADHQALLWAMRPRHWAAAQELQNEDVSDAGGQRTLVIDADRHPLLWALIRARLASQSGMFLDRDGNGVLDAGERSAGEVGTGTTDPEE